MPCAEKSIDNTGQEDSFAATVHLPAPNLATDSEVGIAVEKENIAKLRDGFAQSLNPRLIAIVSAPWVWHYSLAPWIKAWSI
jgi:hypothetical protein